MRRMYVSRPTRSAAGTGPPTGKWGGGAVTRPNGPGMAANIHLVHQTHAAHAYTDTCEHRVVRVIDRLLGRRDAASRERLGRAADAVARELAGNLELTSMFDQTHQAVVFENGEFARHRAVLESEVHDAYGDLADVYARMSETEDAMERRGPAA